ncbi:MAG: hypothetical protein M3O00_15040, partial [Pseudomonadota bacterium]|nr:hypothetical protein [Pseudomonadota bacterium]
MGRTLPLNEATMAIDYRSELRRPTTLGLLALALAGWLLAVVLLFGQATQRREQERQLGLLRTSESDVRRQLEQQRAAAGTLAELQTSAAAA